MATHSTQSQQHSNLWTSALAKCQQPANDAALLLIRAMLAVVFIYHGAQKLFGWWGGHGIEGTAGWMASIGIPLPTLNAILAGGAEFFGGIVLLLGTGARLAAIPMAFTMAVAVYVTSGGGFSVINHGFEYPLTLGVILVAIALLGPGRYTIGNALGLLIGKKEALRINPVIAQA